MRLTQLQSNNRPCPQRFKESTVHSPGPIYNAAMNTQTDKALLQDKPITTAEPRRQSIPEQWSGEERRKSAERRNYSLKTLYQCLLAPRRFNGRRSEDRRFPVMDRFESGLAFLAIGLVVLSILDSVFTLTLIAHGGEEINPFMNWFLQRSVAAFVAVKMALTAIPALILVATGNLLVFKRVRAHSLLAGLLGLYCGLIVYELGLLSLI